MDYGFKIEVSGNSEAQLKAIENAIRSVGQAHAAETEKMKEGVEGMGNSLEKLKKQMIEAFTVEKLFEFGKELLKVTAEFEGFDNVIKYSSLNAIDAEVNISFLKDSIESLHIPMQQAYEGFSEMQAGLIGTGVEGQRMRDVFKGFETMATVRHMPEFTRQRAFYDMKEIAERGINQRSIMGLSGAGVPVRELIKEATGKTIEELKKTMSGGEFIVELSKGMQKHYEGGLENANKSLQAQMTDASNAMLESMRQMGEKLRPLFTEILGAIKGAFDSAPVKFFMDNLMGIVKVVGFAVEVWAVYKGLILAQTVAMGAYAGILKVVEVAEYTATFGMEGFTVAVEGFSAAINTIGWGAIAGGIALIVNMFIQVNDQINTAVENLTKFDKFTKRGQPISEAFGQDVTNFKEFKEGLISSDEAGTAYSKVLGDITTNSKYILDLNEQIKTSSSDLHAQALQRYAHAQALGAGDSKKKYAEIMAAGYVPSYMMDVESEKETGKLKGLKSMLNDAVKQQNELVFDKYYYERKGVKQPSYSPYLDPDKGHKKGALSMVDMTGARGGLGESKIIQIAFNGPFFQANGVKESKDETTHAVQLLARAINNMTASQSQTY